MELMIIAITIIIAILLSIVLNHFFPFLTLPLIQIIIGFGIGFVVINHNVVIDTELILVSFIAPLLYYETKKINTTLLWKNRSEVMVVAFPMVLISVIVLGFFFKSALVLIPLSACFALASALAPTDLVTVTSLSNRMMIPKKNKIILEGEGLINDASGITAFQISTMALLTGKFSIIYSIERLIIICLGGVLIGVLVHVIKNRIELLIRKSGIEDIKFYLILDFLLPFISFLIAEEFHFSGILATVTVGLLEAIKIRRSSLFDAKLNSLADSTWEVVVTILNSLVFIYLGIQLPSIIQEVNTVNKDQMILLIFIIFITTIFLFLIRFILFVLYRLYKNKFKKGINLKDQVILTLSGVKGTVTLVTISSLPMMIDNQDFKHRYTLIFIAAGVIVCSILFAITLLPLILDKKVKDKKNYEIILAKEVIKLLTIEKNNSNNTEIDAVIKVYSDRITHSYIQNNRLSFKEQKKIDKEILKLNIETEYNELNRLFEDNEISENTYQTYRKIIDKLSRKSNKLFYVRFNINNLLYRWLLPFSRKKRSRFSEYNNNNHSIESRDELKKVFINNSEVVIDKLKLLEKKYDKKYIRFKIKEEERIIDLISRDRQKGSLLVNINPNYTPEMEKALQFERNIIQRFYEEGELTLEQSSELKQNVNILEQHYMMDTDKNISYYFLNHR